MKPSFLTLVGLLAASVAANPVPASGGAVLAPRGNGANNNNNGANAAKGKQNGKKNGNNGAAGGAAKNGTANAGGAAGGGAAAGGAAAGGAGAKAGNTSALVLPDGRIKADATPENFNVLESVFKSAVVKGDGLVFSDIITFPEGQASLFDKATNTKAFAINIDDKSVFVPKGGEAQSNIRRADLLPSIRSQLNDVAVTGVRTMHFSIQRDATKPLNASHDYQVFNLESKDFSFHQIDVRTGADNGNEIAVFGNSKTTPPAKIFSTPFGEGQFENFAIKMDFTANTVQVFHSTANEPLKQVTEPVANALDGLGEYHFSLQKNPVGTATQPTGIKEAIIFGGIFMEDSTSGTVTLQ
ncbi:hypothetical protein BDP55DRAFT_707506 [Colletotrichum godetiae]|uniref:Glycoside hydrolase 131 catalytic N-terminal domain-containing protein n=1 Tax=Colletotrichum godetiae TaxID=1209918 RepID=A0AAJ0AAF8_9PEZI|nr:uncharacterized protein BDP55DRAFT_707506 [Colletotrichum godetiae]KAK1659526.1 hypothetical protein BDP55DRAFT_707506 [Colletotrichum godetiae]